MNKSFLIRIEGKPQSCLGSQLLDILTILSNNIKDSIWYAADVEINGYMPLRLNLNGYVPRKIGNLDKMLDICATVDQFNSGVFFAINTEDFAASQFELATEDEEFRFIPNAVIEIRAFDTTYFEIYTANREIVKILTDQYYLITDNTSSDTDEEPHVLYLHIEPSNMQGLHKAHRRHPLRTGKASISDLIKKKPT